MRVPVAVLAVFVALAAPSAAIACACCASPGTWYQALGPLAQIDRDELAKLRFTTAKWVETNEGGPGFGTLRMTARLTGRTWRWQLAGGRTLSFLLPLRATTLAADIHDGKRGGGGGPLLYKELRLEGRLTTSGILRGTRYRLVLQGRGNNCINAADFRSWHLDISGGEPYSLYGTFR